MYNVLKWILPKTLGVKSSTPSATGIIRAWSLLILAVSLLHDTTVDLDFRAFLDFGGGKLTDFGAHWLDVVHMFMGRDAPLSVAAAGGVYYDFHDGRTAPDTISALFEYPGNFTVHFSSLAAHVAADYGVEFLGSGGRLFIDRHRYEFRSSEKGAKPVVRFIPGDITAQHVRNFLDCCRSRKLPYADVYIGHRAAQAALLANQSYLERRRIRFDPEREEVLPFSA